MGKLLSFLFVLFAGYSNNYQWFDGQEMKNKQKEGETNIISACVYTATAQMGS
jgi:hypothetical protein